MLIKFLDPEKPMWQRATALEVLNKLCCRHHLLRLDTDQARQIETNRDNYTGRQNGQSSIDIDKIETNIDN